MYVYVYISFTEKYSEDDFYCVKNNSLSCVKIINRSLTACLLESRCIIRLAKLLCPCRNDSRGISEQVGSQFGTNLGRVIFRRYPWSRLQMWRLYKSFCTDERNQYSPGTHLEQELSNLASQGLTVKWPGKSQITLGMGRCITPCTRVSFFQCYAFGKIVNLGKQCVLFFYIRKICMTPISIYND